MNDELKCPACGNSLRDGAKYCDGCGKPVSLEAIDEAAAALAAATPRPRAGVNWTGVVIVLVVVAVIGWMLLGPKNSGQGQALDQDMGMATPHGSSMDGSTANPHGGQSGMDEGFMQMLDAAKAKLETDPLDRDALFTLYQNYGMIGKAGQLRPYLDKAIAALDEKKDELGDQLVETGMNVGLAALLGSELDGALAVYAKLNELKPGQPDVLAMLGDVCGAADKYEDAIEYYDEYLALEGVDQNDQYWSALANRAIAYRMRYENAEPGAAQQAWLDAAISGLEQATAAQPGKFAPMFNLGLAYGLAGQQDKALASYAQARALAADEMEQWQVDAEVAKLKGETPPPQPASDSMGMNGMGMEGMANPHGGATSSGEDGGAANPHSGAGGMANPHGGS